MFIIYWRNISISNDLRWNAWLIYIVHVNSQQKIMVPMFECPKSLQIKCIYTAKLWCQKYLSTKIEMINVSISGEKVNAPFWHPQQRKHTRPYWAKWIPSPAGMLIKSFLVPKYAALYICMQKLLSIPCIY